MFTVICDNCGKDSSEDCDYSAWNDQDYAWDCAKEDDWIEVENKHYCNDCYSFDDNDNLLIKFKK